MVHLFRRAGVLVMLLWLVACAAVSEKPAAAGHGWWDRPKPTSFDATRLQPQSYIRVQGNRFVDDRQQTVVFRGVNIADPDWVYRKDQWRKGLFEEIHRWGANVVRLPVHPVAWRGRGEQGYFDLLDQAVLWANELGLYLILDWHSIGYLPNELFQSSIYNTTHAETLYFWKAAAARYKNVPTLALYEIFNEPTTMGGTLGQPDWDLWKAQNEKIIDLIRANNPAAIPVVTGFDWAYDLTPIRAKPIARDGIAYAVHPYPQKVTPQPPTEENYHKAWQQGWGFVAASYPLIATEIGWVKPDGKGPHVPVINDGSYGPQIVSFMEARGISWTVWCFDPDWSPTMVQDWRFTPTQQGEFFRQVLQEKNTGAR